MSRSISPPRRAGQARTEAAGYENVEFLAADVYELPFEQGASITSHLLSAGISTAAREALRCCACSPPVDRSRHRG